MAVAPENKRVQVTFPIDLLEKLTKLAEQDRRTLSQYLTVTMEKYIEEKEASGGTQNNPS